MKIRVKDMNKEFQEEMVGILTAISIVSKRLAGRLLKADTSKPISKAMVTVDEKGKNSENHNNSNINYSGNK